MVKIYLFVATIALLQLSPPVEGQLGLGTLVGGVTNTVGSVANVGVGAVTTGALTSGVGNVVSTGTDVVGGITNAGTNVVGGVVTAGTGVVGGVVGGVASLGTGLVSSILSGGLIGGLLSFVSNMSLGMFEKMINDMISSMFALVLSAAKTVYNEMKAAFWKVLNFVIEEQMLFFKYVLSFLPFSS